MAQDIIVGGKKFPKWGVYASIAGGLGVVGYVFIQRKKKNAATAGNSGTSVDPVTGLPYSEDNTVDPLTGITYLQEAQQYGSVSAAESSVQAGNSVSPYSYGTTESGSSAGSYYTPYSTFTGTQTGTNYTSNAQWAQAVEAGLTDIGYAPTDVSAALGRYLAGLSLTSSQASIIQAGLAEYGNPPAGSFTVILQPSTTPASTGNTVKVPNVVGGSLGDAHNILAAAGLKLATTETDPSFWKVTGQHPAAGTSVNAGSSVTVTVVHSKTPV